MYACMHDALNLTESTVQVTLCHKGVEQVASRPGRHAESERLIKSDSKLQIDRCIACTYAGYTAKLDRDRGGDCSASAHAGTSSQSTQIVDLTLLIRTAFRSQRTKAFDPLSVTGDRLHDLCGLVWQRFRMVYTLNNIVCIQSCSVQSVQVYSGQLADSVVARAHGASSPRRRRRW